MYSVENDIFGGQFVTWYFHQPHLMWSTLVDFYSCRNQSLFFIQRIFDEILDSSLKSLKHWSLTRYESRGEPVKVKQLPLKWEDSNFKGEAFPQGERGRQAVVYMEGVLIVRLVSFHLFTMHK